MPRSWSCCARLRMGNSGLPRRRRFAGAISLTRCRRRSRLSRRAAQSPQRDRRTTSRRGRLARTGRCGAGLGRPNLERQSLDLRSPDPQSLARRSLFQAGLRMDRQRGQLGRRTTGRLALLPDLRRGRAVHRGRAVRRVRRDEHLGPSRAEAGREANLLAVDQLQAADFRPSRPGRSRNTRNGRSIIGRLQPGRKRHGDLRRSRLKTSVRGSRPGCTLSRCRISGVQNGQGLNARARPDPPPVLLVPVRLVRPLDGLAGFARVEIKQAQDVRALFGHSAARAAWRGPLPPAAASRGPAGHGPAASPAKRAGAAMAPVQDAAVRAPVRMRGPASVGNGRLRSRAAPAVRPSGLTRRVERLLKVSVPAARARARSAERARVGSPSRASIERAREIKERRAIDPDTDLRPKRADSRNPGSRGSRARQPRSGLLRVRNGPGRAADDPLVEGRRLVDSCIPNGAFPGGTAVAHRYFRRFLRCETLKAKRLSC